MTIPQLFMRQATIRPGRCAYATRTSGAWQQVTWGEYVLQTRQAARALIELGLQPGQSVCILGFNRPEWTIFSMAAMSCGGVPAGIYTTNSAEEITHIVNHAEARFILIEDLQQWRKIEGALAAMPNLEYVITMRDCPVITHPRVRSWTDFIGRGGQNHEPELERRLSALEPEATATLIYTSGTTGPAKGVMLSHRNLLWTAEVTVQIMAGRDNDRMLSFLPLSHVAEQLCTILAPAITGHSIYFARSMDTVPEDIREVEPTIFFGVPRLWEKFHAGVKAKFDQETGASAKMLRAAMAVARRYHAQVIDKGFADLRTRAAMRIARRLVFAKLKPKLGLAHARLCLTGAAPIDPQLLHWFTGLDLVVHELYGQSEGTGPTTLNRPGRTRLGTVGPAYPGIELKIADDGEILMRGPHVFKGYLKDEAATKACFHGDWARTGDIGSIDSEGFLTITGRKKEILVTAGGVNITPTNLEQAIAQLPLINQVVVIGDRRKYLTAVVTLDDEQLKRLAKAKACTIDDVRRSPDIRDDIDRGLEAVNRNFARASQVRKYCVIEGCFSIENGELTPTMKLRRKVIEDHYHQEIEQMYDRVA